MQIGEPYWTESFFSTRMHETTQIKLELTDASKDANLATLEGLMRHIRTIPYVDDVHFMNTSAKNFPIKAREGLPGNYTVWVRGTPGRKINARIVALLSQESVPVR